MDVDGKPVFAVFVPSSEADESIGRVFDTVIEATAFAKENKTRGARFKQFSDAASAKMFAEGLMPETPRRPTAKESALATNDGAFSSSSSSPSSISEGPPSPFSAVSRQDLSAFKRAIEGHDDAKFEELIQDNPRYIVNYNGDTPTIVFEGSRYNALHIAARSKNEHAARRVLELVGDVDHRLFHRLYPEDPYRINERRRLHLLDCYLNTPDKSLNETPLHFAAKLGCASIVEQLVSYKECQKEIRNKYGQTPGEMACDKMTNTTPEDCGATKRRILSLLSTVFVPLYRPIDFSGSAVLLPPVSEYPSEVLSGSAAMSKSLVGGDNNGSVAISPALRSEMRLAAVAGPCSTEQAAKFHQAWASSKRDVKRADIHKGYEQAGRALAAELGLEWTEWWPFLGVYANLTTPLGLTLLEKHLTDAAAIAATNDDAASLSNLPRNALTPQLSTSSSSSVGRGRVDARLQSSPWFGGGPRALFTNSLSRLDSSKVKKRLQFADVDEEKTVAPLPTGQQQISDAARVNIVVDDADDSMDFQDSLSDPCSSSIDMAELCEQFNRHGSLSDNEDDDEDKFVTPPSTPPPVFMVDVCPTKVDCDVHLAVSLAMQRNSGLLEDFPRVRRWFYAVQTYSPKQRNDWPSLDSPRAKCLIASLSACSIDAK
uniref:Ankyrin repeat and LEM domain-containing protein 2 n=1 Tax=Plectus sambesii TaxID=2011161 RepID=A0A914X0X7_9BILA